MASKTKTIELDPKFLIPTNENKDPKNRKSRKAKPNHVTTSTPSSKTNTNTNAMRSSTVGQSQVKQQFLQRIQAFKKYKQQSEQAKLKIDTSIKNTPESPTVTKYNSSVDLLKEVAQRRAAKKKRKEERRLKRETMRRMTTAQAPSSSSSSSQPGVTLTIHEKPITVETELPISLQELPIAFNKTAFTVEADTPRMEIQTPEPVPVPEPEPKPEITPEVLVQEKAPEPLETNRIEQITSLPPAPPYSNLKNSSKLPTYRNWLTRKNLANVTSAATADTLNVNVNDVSSRKRTVRTLKKYRLGKHANGTVSVLIKNADTRERVKSECDELKTKPILEVKNYLRSKYLLKIGSDIPDEIAREMYENAIMTGEVTNKSRDNLFHNFFSTKEDDA